MATGGGWDRLPESIVAFILKKATAEFGVPPALRKRSPEVLTPGQDSFLTAKVSNEFRKCAPFGKSLQGSVGVSIST